MTADVRETNIPWLRGAALPAHWSETKVKHLAPGMQSGENITAEDIEPDGIYPVYGGNGLRGYTESFTHSGTRLLIGRQGALCGNVHLVQGEFWASEHAIVAEVAPAIDPRWLAHLLRVMDLGQYSQTSAQPGIGTGQINALAVPLPPAEEQRAIADYLDRETVQIDELIAEQHRLIDMLAERRTAVIDSVVTSGLHRTVTTRDTGVAWVGPIPAHWETRPLWSMFQRVKDVDHPDEQMLSVFRDYGVIAKGSRENINQTAENRSIYQLVHPGWLVTNRMKAWQGSVGISTLRGIVSGHYICFAPQHNENHDYLNWLFRSPRYTVGYGLISRGVRIGQAEIDNDDYRVLPVVVPPLAEQRAIVAHLVEQTSTIDTLIEEAQRFIELARERRSALITAAVTGQIDVRRAA